MLLNDTSAIAIARCDLMLSIGAVPEAWTTRLRQSVRLLTNILGDHEAFKEWLIKNGHDPAIIDESYDSLANSYARAASK